MSSSKVSSLAIRCGSSLHQKESLSGDFVFAKRKLNVSLLGSPLSHNHRVIIFNRLLVAGARLCLSGVGLARIL